MASHLIELVERAKLRATAGQEAELPRQAVRAVPGLALGLALAPEQRPTALELWTIQEERSKLAALSTGVALRTLFKETPRLSRQALGDLLEALGEPPGTCAALVKTVFSATGSNGTLKTETFLEWLFQEPPFSG
ncbi:unnamed protein product [Effrenium voratum]|nr:unnamed protein product [Effrenium voratum]